MEVTKTGLIREPMKLRNYDYEKVFGSVGSVLPTSYTIPEEKIPDVHNQEQTYSCVGFATAQCAEGHFNEGHFSPFFTYGRRECRKGYTGKGMYVSDALKGLLKIGFLKEVYFDVFEDIPDVIQKANARDDLLKISEPKKPKGFVNLNYSLVSKKWDAIKSALYNNKEPIVLASTSKRFGGGHAIIGIGYAEKVNNRAGKFVLIQNSWGKAYENNGRCYIDLNEIDEAYQFVWDNIEIPFNDVKANDWFYDDVKAMYFAGVVNGITEKEFYPNQNIVRADVAFFLEKLLRKVEYSVNCYIKTCEQKGKIAKEIAFNEKNNKIKFKDVNDKEYYSDSVYFAVANDILNGKDDNKFEPQSDITRAELATVLVRTIEKIDSKLDTAMNTDYQLPKNKVNQFQDVQKTDWFYNYVQKANEYGLMEGDNLLFRPQDNITRAEATAVMQRLFKIVEQMMEQ